MDLSKSILETIREAVGLTPIDSNFDTELLIHINSALGKLNQNGVGNFIIVTDISTTWGDFQNPEQTTGNQYFKTVPFFVALSTKLLFDPPPPSNAQYLYQNVQEMLWRLKIAYEEPVVIPTVEEVI